MCGRKWGGGAAVHGNEADKGAAGRPLWQTCKSSGGAVTWPGEGKVDAEAGPMVGSQVWLWV